MSDQKPLPLDYARPGSDKLVRVATYTDAVEANLARNRLEAEGIRCMSTGEELLGGVGTYGGTMGKVELSVGVDDEQAARRVLDEIAQTRASNQQSSHAPPCPSCGAANARTKWGKGAYAAIAMLTGAALTVTTRSAWWVMAALVVALYFILTWDEQRWRCVKCGSKFAGRAIETPRRDEDQGESN